ncbi:MAG: hypothetical protein WAU60_05270 [Candidatus Competibacter denitrificans]
MTAYSHAVLFSARCFRQRGAYYLPLAMPSPLAPFSESEEIGRVSGSEVAA